MKRIDYKNLNARQKEIYNFQKVSAIFADFGFTTVKLADDWMGADFIAISFDGLTYLKVQLKGRMTFEKKYIGKGIHICFCDRVSGKWYLYPHDETLEKFLNKIENSVSWKLNGGYSFPGLSTYAKSVLSSNIFE